MLHFEDCTGFSADASSLDIPVVKQGETTVNHVDGGTSSVSEDEDDTVNNGDTSDAPEVLDHRNATPMVDSGSTTPLCSDLSTPVIMCTGRENRRSPISLKLELEQALLASSQEKSSYVINNENNDPLHKEPVLHQDSDTVLLNNIFELHNIYRSEICNSNSADLVAKIEEQGKAIRSLEREKETQKIYVEKLGAELFQKEQKLKIAADRVKQLENTDGYRREVERLEELVEKGKAEMKIVLERKRR